MSKARKNALMKTPDALFDRVVSILEQTRGNVVRAVNTNMVLAYWMIGREIVEEIQRGKGRAKYGQKVIEDLSARLTERYGQGFSVTNLWYFRQFYLAFADRSRIPHPAGGELANSPIPHPAGTELTPMTISRPLGDQSQQGFCTEKNETVARYSVLNDRKQIFASKYMLCLPTEEQLRLEVERERRLIEAAREDRDEEFHDE